MTEAWFETWSGGGTLGSREAGLLLDAVAKDAENGDWGVYNWFLADNDADNYDLRIQFEYKLPESQFNRIHDTIRINVKEGMTETIPGAEGPEIDHRRRSGHQPGTVPVAVRRGRLGSI